MSTNLELFTTFSYRRIFLPELEMATQFLKANPAVSAAAYCAMSSLLWRWPLPLLSSWFCAGIPFSKRGKSVHARTLLGFLSTCPSRPSEFVGAPLACMHATLFPHIPLRPPFSSFFFLLPVFLPGCLPVVSEHNSFSRWSSQSVLGLS